MTIPSITQLKKTHFHSQITTCVNIFSARGQTSFSSPLLQAGTLPALHLYESCMCCHSLCWFVCESALFCMESMVFLKSSSTSCSYSFSMPSLNISLTFMGKVVLLSPYLELGALKSGILCMLTSCGSSKVLSYCKSGKLLYLDGNKSMRVILLLCLFSRIIVVGFPLRPMTHLVTNFGVLW